jgi:hypothetical protein
LTYSWPPAQALSQMPGITYLDVSHCRDVTDDGIAMIANGRLPLTELVARGMAAVTGVTLGQLPKLRSLRYRSQHVRGMICPKIFRRMPAFFCCLQCNLNCKP